VLVCGSGIGMCMTANRFPGVRAALAPTIEHARLGRAHNNANVLCLGERLTPADQALAILDVFLATDFDGGRHQRRIEEIDQVAGMGR
jgi:ribose 5-phosphate isomerase B